MFLTFAGNKKVPKKRGRKPRSTKDSKTKEEEEEEEEEDYQPRQKKKRLDSNKFNSNSSSGGGSSNVSNNKNDKKRKSGRVNKIKEFDHDKDSLIKSGESWIQGDLCNQYTNVRIAKCRECRMTQNQRDKVMPSRSAPVFCRFYAFRRMVYTKTGGIVTAGFNDPFLNAGEVRKLYIHCLFCEIRNVFFIHADSNFICSLIFSCGYREKTID